LNIATLLAGLAALSSASFAAGLPVQASPTQGETAAGPAAAPAPPAPQASAKVCFDVHTGDPLTEEFANRLKAAIAASGTFGVASTGQSCDLKLHVPGNLLRFETAGGVMVSTVVIVTASSGRYLSSSITACRANDLEPCAARAVAVAKLAWVVSSSAT
jgi:hypothetical protein